MDHDLNKLVEQLASDDATTTHRAAQAIAQQMPAAKQAAIPLIRSLATPHLDTREWAVSALEDMGAPGEADLSQLVDLVLDYCDGRLLVDQVYWAITLIGRLDAAAASATSALIAVLVQTDEDPIIEKTIWALGAIGPDASEARRFLVEFSEGEQPRIARLAQHALTQLSN